jgi:hypothetical protein
LGRVSPGEVASVGADERRVVIDVDFDTYLRVGARIGEYLGVATILGSVMLGRVVEVRRRHVAHIAHIQTLYATVEDLEGLKTPAQIVLEPLTECPIDVLDSCEPTPVYTPVDPLSVVFRPSPEFIAKMLGLPREGILPRCSVASSPGVCQRGPAFVSLEGLRLQLSTSAAEARCRIHSSRGGPTSLGTSANSRRLSRFLSAPRGIRPPPAHWNPAAVVGGGVLRRFRLWRRRGRRFCRRPSRGRLSSSPPAIACRGGCAVRRCRSPQILRH